MQIKIMGSFTCPIKDIINLNMFDKEAYINSMKLFEIKDQLPIDGSFGIIVCSSFDFTFSIMPYSIQKVGLQNMKPSLFQKLCNNIYMYILADYLKNKGILLNLFAEDMGNNLDNIVIKMMECYHQSFLLLRITTMDSLVKFHYSYYN